ncbi:hypothetical protein EDC04DRAFT_2906045 [Pisolithus marmoratus]|nr:hypothetical protein EDC04DRAFT_2906045 [Pisolithus marmoratus]
MTELSAPKYSAYPGLGQQALIPGGSDLVEEEEQITHHGMEEMSEECTGDHEDAEEIRALKFIEVGTPSSPSIALSATPTP